MIVIEQNNGFWTEIFPNYLGGCGAILAVIVALWQTHRANKARELAANEKSEAEQIVNNKTLKLFDSATANERVILSNLANQIDQYYKEYDIAVSEPSTSKEILLEGCRITFIEYMKDVKRDKILKSVLSKYKTDTSSMLSEYHLFLSERSVELITKRIENIELCYYNILHVYKLPLESINDWSNDKLYKHMDELFDIENQLREISAEFINK